MKGTFREVYFLRESGMGAIKIGVTRNLTRRVQSMNANTPHKISILGSVRGDEKLEARLQDEFAHALIKGEWFHPTETLLARIRELTNFDLVDLVIER
jgi:hypothetical protein